MATAVNQVIPPGALTEFPVDEAGKEVAYSQVRPTPPHQEGGGWCGERASGRCMPYRVTRTMGCGSLSLTRVRVENSSARMWRPSRSATIRLAAASATCSRTNTSPVCSSWTPWAPSRGAWSRYIRVRSSVLLESSQFPSLLSFPCVRQSAGGVSLDVDGQHQPHAVCGARGAARGFAVALSEPRN